MDEPDGGDKVTGKIATCLEHGHGNINTRPVICRTGTLHLPSCFWIFELDSSELLFGETREDDLVPEWVLEVQIGSRFKFCISLGISQDAKEKSFNTVPSLQNKHVVVVDDNPTAREILATYLESFTFKVDQAANANGATRH